MWGLQTPLPSPHFETDETAIRPLLRAGEVVSIRISRILSCGVEDFLTRSFTPLSTLRTRRDVNGNGQHDSTLWAWLDKWTRRILLARAHLFLKDRHPRLETRSSIPSDRHSGFEACILQPLSEMIFSRNNVQGCDLRAQAARQ